MLTLALPTGRMLGDCLTLLKRVGVPCSALEKPGRGLVFEQGNIRFLLGKPMDLPLYVHYGSADLALAGNDVIMERGVPLVDLCDTGLGRCRLVVAAPRGASPPCANGQRSSASIRIATKYPRITKAYFGSRGIRPRCIHLHGSIELAPLLHISDAIVDIVQSGNTLRANDLEVLEEVAPVSLRLVASRSSARLKWDIIRDTLLGSPENPERSIAPCSNL